MQASTMYYMKYQFIAIEGPIGVGKSTLASQLATQFKASYLTDTEESNPYLPTFYRDPSAAAFHTQIHFLTSRLEKLKNPAVMRPNQPMVADFLLAKDRLFAELTLDHTEWSMYSSLYEQQVKGVPKPDLVVYLQAPLERLIERIERRGIGHEQRIDSNYLQQLSALYERFFYAYAQTPLLIVNASDVNLADDPLEVKNIANRISELEGGRHYFNPVAAAS